MKNSKEWGESKIKYRSKLKASEPRPKSNGSYKNRIYKTFLKKKNKLN